MEKILTIDGKEVGFRSTALLPRMYRQWLGRDIVVDMNRLAKNFRKAEALSPEASEEKKQDAQLSVMDLEIFENAAYAMAKLYAMKHGDSFPPTAEDWIDSFGTFSIYEILPHLLELWQINGATTSIPVKK